MPERYDMPLDELMPNNPDLPVLIYRGVIDGKTAGEIFQNIFLRNGWRGVWRGGIYDYHHYHSTSHEVLGVAQGQATLRLGGVRGMLFHVRVGDCLILPAGTGHCCVDATSDFAVIGAYPAGQENYDIQRSWQDKLGIRDDIRHVPEPGTNPLCGLIDGAETLWTRDFPDFLDTSGAPVSYTPCNQVLMGR